MTSTITARRLLRGNEIVEYPLITVNDGHITSIESRENAAAGDAVYGFPEAMLVPAYVNIHVHGAVRLRRNGRHSAGAARGRSVSCRPRSGSVLPHHRHLIH